MNKHIIKNRYKKSKTNKKIYKSIKCVKTNKHIMLGGANVDANNKLFIPEHNNQFYRKIYLYFNKELGIEIYTSGQLKINLITPDLFTRWFKLLKAQNIKLYITFNNNDEAYLDYTEEQKEQELKNKNTEDYSKETQLEKTTFAETCVNDKDKDKDKEIYKCKFVSIEVIDYTAPNLKNLITFWKELDEFYIVKKKQKYISSNVLIHCTSGIGRTGFMLCSYIWLKKLEKEKTEEHKIITISTENIKTLLSKEKQILLQLSNKDTIHIPTNYNIHSLYISLKKEDAIEFLKEEMQKFNPEFLTELFNISYNRARIYVDITLIKMIDSPDKKNDVILFINRIAIFIEAYEAYEAYDEHRKQTL